MTQPLYHLHNSLTDLLFRILPIHSFWLSTSAPVRRQIHWKSILKCQISSGIISNGAIICCILLDSSLCFTPLEEWVCMGNYFLKPDRPLYSLILYYFSFAWILQSSSCCTADKFILLECWSSPDVYSTCITILSFISSWSQSQRQRC